MASENEETKQLRNGARIVQSGCKESEEAQENSLTNAWLKQKTHSKYRGTRVGLGKKGEDQRLDDQRAPEAAGGRRADWS